MVDKVGKTILVNENKQIPEKLLELKINIVLKFDIDNYYEENCFFERDSYYGMMGVSITCIPTINLYVFFRLLSLFTISTYYKKKLSDLN